MKTDEFLCGVIEGYYGRPWSFNQRKHLFEYCSRFGLNSYVYAPKDDLKHRSRWRDLYSNEELIELSQLINHSKRCGIHFIYAISPGLDLIYSSEKDFLSLKRKLDQLSNLGCQSWSILFDDIDSEMSQQDQNHFLSFAHAQTSITNQIFDYLNKPNIFLFCPTEYCTQMAKPNIEKSLYLQTIGSNLHPEIQIFWTGPKVISRRITSKHLQLINHIVKRRVTIWDNLNANDYDQRRLCLGPLTGRSSSICSHINGMLINPNCEFELNFIPLNTLGQWFQSLVFHSNDEQIDDNDVNNLQTNSISTIYQCEQALERAILDWLPEFSRIKSSNENQSLSKIEHSPQEMSPKPNLSCLNVDEDSQDSLNEHNQCSTTISSKVHRMECDINGLITVDDIRLLVDLFYLPYQYGSKAQQMLLDFHWLRFNSSIHQKINEWHCRSLSFHNQAKLVHRLVQRLLSIPNRCLLYDLYSYISEMNSTLSLCSRYIHWIENPNRTSTVFLSGDIDPGSKRGDLQGELLNLIPLGDFQTLIKPEINNQTNIYFIRSMNNNDQTSIYKLSRTLFYQEEFKHLLDQHQDILVDKFIGGYWLTSINKFDLCFAVDGFDDQQSLFILTLIDSQHYDKYIQSQWIEQLQKKYSNIEQNVFEMIECPNWIYEQYPVRIEILPDISMRLDQIYSIGLKLMQILTENLLQRGFHGCHALLDEQNSSLYQYYLRLGFTEIPTIDQTDHSIILGKQF